MEIMKHELHLKIDDIFFYSDSTIALGYISNDSRRFLVYVANRVQRIRNVSHPEQWRHISTDANVSDMGTRGVSATDLANSPHWFTGPEIHGEELKSPSSFEVPPGDKELRKVLLTSVESSNDFAVRFSKFSSWKRLVIGVVRIQKSTRRDFSNISVTDLKKSELTILRIVQREHFPIYFSELSGEDSQLKSLDPFIGDDGMLRVGGRLRLSGLSTEEKHPIILPRNCHVGRLVATDLHVKTHHQGRHITSGAIRDAGFWIIGMARLVGKLIHECVFCKRVRGRALTPKMACLPAARISRSPPFSFIGIDVMGPWNVVLRKTRGHKASTKRWGLLITCLYCRAVHIETLESLSADSFLCALRRFIALRGPAQAAFTDCGTNFVGASSQLKEMEREIREFSVSVGMEWNFNPPHSSHYGGVFERMIRSVRQIMDNMFLVFGDHQITTEILTTFFAEVAGILNSRPIVAVSSDPECPETLSPSVLLTGKTRPATADGEFGPEDLYARNWWRTSQYLADQFWLRWRKEYLQSLQVRQKWTKTVRPFKPGDVVLLKDAQAHRSDWPKGIVQETMVSHDGVTRKVKVKSGRTLKVYTRPAHQLVLLVGSKGGEECDGTPSG